MDRRAGLVRLQQHGQSGTVGQGSQGQSQGSSFSFVFMTSPPTLLTIEAAGHYSYDAGRW
jgi:hypothetical protein